MRVGTDARQISLRGPLFYEIKYLYTLWGHNTFDSYIKYHYHMQYWKSPPAGKAIMNRVSAASKIPINCAATVTKKQPPTNSNSMGSASISEEPTSAETIKITRVPCRARGVCDSHNSYCAYFEIPEDCQHGTYVVCSHKVCRESAGRSFRYCKPCNQVAAARNFNRRHAHGVTKRLVQCPPANSIQSTSFSRGATNSRKRKLSDDVDTASSLVSFFLDDAMWAGTDGDTMAADPAGRSDPRRFANAMQPRHTELSESMLVMATQRDLDLLELVRRRLLESDSQATIAWIQDVVDATKNNTHNITAQNIMMNGVLGGEVPDPEPAARTQSPDYYNFDDIFEDGPVDH